MPKFDYAVKYNGKYYPAGSDIPEPAPAEEKPWKYEGPETSSQEAAQEAAETAQEAAETAQEAAQESAEVEAEATAEEKAEAPEKTTKRGKKGDAR